LVRRFNLNGSGLDLATLGQGARGQLAFDVEASGPIDRLTGRGQARMEDLAWRQVEVGSASLGIEARDGRGDLMLEVPSFHVSGRGTLVSVPRPQLSATITLSEAPFAPLSPLVPAAAQPLDGRLSGEVSLAVPLRTPEKATVTARIDSVDVVSGRYSARATQPFTVAASNGMVSLRDFAAEGSGLTVGASGQVGMGPAGAVEMSVTAQADLAQLPAPPPWRIVGGVDAVIDVTGRVDHPVGRGAITLRGLEAMLNGGEALLSVPEGQIQLEGERALVQEVRGQLAGGRWCSAERSR
jgi:autotransporter translocation and assembly factor TamB